MKTKKDTDRFLILSQISEPMRLRILFIIASGHEACAVDILSELDITQPTLSHHMSVLEECGAVNVRREGRKAFYSINTELLKTINDLSLALRGEVPRMPAATAAPRTRSAGSAPVKKAAPKQPKPVVSEEPEKKSKKKKDKDKKKKDKKKKK